MADSSVFINENKLHFLESRHHSGSLLPRSSENDAAFFKEKVFQVSFSVHDNRSQNVWEKALDIASSPYLTDKMLS